VPRAGDTDFTVERLIARADSELANGIGNLVNRVVAIIHRYREGWAPAAWVPDGAGDLAAACRDAPARIDAALADFAFRDAAEAVWAIADQANRHINLVRPWDLAKAEVSALDGALSGLYGACQILAAELSPFLPDAAARIAAQLTTENGILPAPCPSSGGWG
jgi:methionyl-tRNA synthetase